MAETKDTFLSEGKPTFIVRQEELGEANVFLSAGEHLVLALCGVRRVATNHSDTVEVCLLNAGAAVLQRLLRAF